MISQIALRGAVHLAHARAGTNTSAQLRAADATALLVSDAPPVDVLRAALGSLRHSVGILHPDYRDVNDAFVSAVNSAAPRYGVRRFTTGRGDGKNFELYELATGECASLPGNKAETTRYAKKKNAAPLVY